jgi:hypothetical protein
VSSDTGRGIIARMTAATTTAQASSRSLAALLAEGAPYAEISSHLDGLSPEARLAEVLGITGKRVGKLYEAVAGGPTVTLDEMVAPGEKGTVIYEGRNSLPAFSRFQKRFLRLPSGVIVGYNHQTMSFVTGPGYFLVKAADGKGEHGKELFFDYTEAPPEAPAGWPAYKPNDRGLSNSVYGGMIDYVRRVARGVVVGKAYRGGVSQNAYFSLTHA